jgi:hypothetical protein
MGEYQPLHPSALSLLEDPPSLADVQMAAGECQVLNLAAVDVVAPARVYQPINYALNDDVLQAKWTEVSGVVDDDGCPVQNANLICDLPETAGLDGVPVWP